eukprot:3386583-Rhodomonas_salina.2
MNQFFTGIKFEARAGPARLTAPVCGTDLGYAATRLASASKCDNVAPARPGTCLRTSYAMSGTGTAHGVT